MIDIARQIIFEDNHLVAVNKLAGQLVQPDDEGSDLALEDFLKEYIREKFDKPGAVFLGVIHRLDRPVSGVCVFARTSKALERMNKLFATREISKTYWALVSGKPPRTEDTLVHWLVKATDRNMVSAYNNDKKGGVRAELSYKLLKQAHGFSLLEIKPLTGRPHQIRVQLSKIGIPIVGDIKYGAEKPNIDKSICLHAKRLEFMHPVKNEPVVIEADVAEDSMISMAMM